MTTIVMPLSSQ